MKKILILAFLFAMQLQFAYATDPHLINVPVTQEKGAKENLEEIKPYLDNLPNDYIPCYDTDPNDDCGSWLDWSSKYVIISLPDFPDCPITVKYDTRICNSGKNTQYLITHIAIPTTGDCQDLYNYLNDPVKSVASKRQSQMRHELYVLIGKDDFIQTNDYVIGMGSCPLYCTIPPGSNCVKPYDHVKVSYIETSCLGYCLGYYSVRNSDNRYIVMLPKACDATNCCKYENEFCIDYITKDLVHTETKTTIGPGSSDCNNMPDLEPCTKLMSGNPGLIDVWTLPCGPTCNF